MLRRLLGIPLAAVLLVVGATAALAQSGAAPAVVSAATGAGSLLSDVLDDLVGDGTINQDQADKIEAAVEARREELRAEAERLREQMRTFLEDGALSADELAQLPADHPLRNLDRFLEDGQLTRDELDQLRFGFGFGLGRGHHGQLWIGPLGDRAPAPDASGSPDASPDADSSSTS